MMISSKQIKMMVSFLMALFNRKNQVGDDGTCDPRQQVQNNEFLTAPSQGSLTRKRV